MTPLWMAHLKSQLKGVWKKQRLALLRRWFGFGPEELRRALHTLGIHSGDTLLVHSSLDRLECFTGKISELIVVLQEAVGSEGLLLMPTLPFSGTALEWVRSGNRFDATTTPSRSGLLTELFRRSRGVIRSIHPTHPVAAWGRQAQAFCRDHPACATPCGHGSPYANLLEANGKILLLGAGIESLTFFHAAEEILESRLPRSPFTQERFELLSRAPDGALIPTITRLFDPALSRQRRIARMVPELKRRGEWHGVRLGTAAMIRLDARVILTTLTAMADEGRFCYAP
ncbi:MAG: AAC(3) family N-acetyltransferase [Magnetococcales bacterium]|nr:AAC(3) family N-acetyltransferase [Magnetococcales bacterium]